MPRPIPFALLLVFVEAIGFGILIPLLPSMLALHFPNQPDSISLWIGLLSSAFSLAQFLAAPVLGVLSDRWGRYRILLLSACGLAVAFWMQATATSVWELLLGRIVGGVTGASVATANATIAEYSAPERQVQAFGWVGAVFGLGLMLGPAIGGYLGEIAWSLPLYVACAAAIGTLIFGTVQRPMVSRSLGDTILVSNRRPMRGAETKAYPQVVRKVLIAIFISAMAQRGLESLFALYTWERFGWTKRDVGSALLLVGCLSLLVQGVMVRPVVARIGAKRTVLLSGLSLATAYGGMAWITTGGWVYPLLVLGAFGGLAGPALQSLVAGWINHEEQGRLQGTVLSIVSAASILGPLIFVTFVYQRVGNSVPLRGLPFALGAACVLLSTGLLARALRKPV